MVRETLARVEGEGLRDFIFVVVHPGITTQTLLN
jgi:hypothetical protein